MNDVLALCNDLPELHVSEGQVLIESAVRTDLNGFKGEDAPPLIVAKGYTAENFARLMRTGITASGKTSTSGLMSEVGQERFPSMTDDEVRYLKAYLDAR